MRKKLLMIALAAIMLGGSVAPIYTACAADAQKTSEESTESEDSYKESTLTITENSYVVDTFKGVDAVYRPGKNDGSNATYSCAAYIKKFYKEVYDVSVYNLFGGSTPLTYEGNKFKSISTPKVGDIAATSSHWAIVKSVDKENNKVILIEQNYKWQQGGQTVCRVNRSVSSNDLSFYRLSK